MECTSDSPTRLRLIVSDCTFAQRYKPNDITGVIRIYGNEALRGYDYPPLKPSSLFTGTLSYTFDDIGWLTPHEMDTLDSQYPEEYVFFSVLRATRLIRDVHQLCPSIDTLLIHSRYGSSRSPAVAMGLNDVLDLGYDTAQLAEQMSGYNTTIYEQMLRAGTLLRNSGEIPQYLPPFRGNIS